MTSSLEAAGVERSTWARYRARAHDELVDSIVPFWWRTIDRERGGVFNCWDNRGVTLVRRDKFVWSQGRFAWLCARLADVTRRGLLRGDAGEFLAQAEKTVRFLQHHAFLPDGRCAFLLSEDGAVQEAFAGGGLAPSIYADCFVVMGFAEYARVSGDRSVLDAAWQLFENLEQRIAAGGFPTFPEPIPAGYEPHAVAMITLNLTLVLGEACEQLGDSRAAAMNQRQIAAAQRIFERFMLPGGRIVEMRPKQNESNETLLSRHVNPGHALEGLWMLLTVAQRMRRMDWTARAIESVHFQLSRGWDDEQGGLLHYVDHLGGPPVGEAGESVYESSVRSTWDTKLWWVHSEAIYTSALAAKISDRRDSWEWFERLWRYSFNTFPNPDRAVGEWIQIRDRRGEPLDRVVALPVKDPYHIVRNLLQVLELSSGDIAPASK